MPILLARKREITLLIVLQFVHLIIISAQVPLHGKTSVLEAVLFRMLSPFQRAAFATFDGVVSFYEGYVGLRRAHVENEELRARLHAALQEMNRLRTEQGEIQRLEQLLRLAENLPYTTEAAHVIGADSLNPMRMLYIDKGSKAGIRHNCPVISPEGYLVGRVITPVAPAQATVQLLTDADASVGAILSKSRAYGVVGGTDDGRCTLRFVPTIVDVAPGEELHTSGLDQIYPRGIIIGKVLSSTTTGSVFRDVTVEPFVSIHRLEYVLVLTGEKSGGAPLADGGGETR